MIQYHPELTQPIIFKERIFTKIEKSHDRLEPFSRHNRGEMLIFKKQVLALILQSSRFLLMALSAYSFVFFTKSSTKSSVNISPKKNIGQEFSGTFIFMSRLSLKESF